MDGAHHVQLQRSRRCQAEGVLVHLHGPQRVSHAFSKWGGFTLTFADRCGYFNGKKIIINQDTVNHGNLMDFGGFPMILKRKPTPGEALISRQPHVTALGAQPNHSWVAARSSRPDSIILDLEISGTAYHLDFFFVVNLSLRDQIAKVQNEYVLGTNGVSFHIFWLSANPYPTPTGVLCHVQQQVQQRKSEGTMSCMPTAPPLPRTTAAATLGLGMADAWRIIPVVS